MNRIRKLLALAENHAATPSEAANAAARVQQLLLQYNIDMQDVRRAEGKSATFPIVMVDHELPGSGAQWRRWVADTVAEVNLCTYIGTVGDPKRGKIIGQEHNIKVVAYLIDVLIQEIMRIAREAWRVLSPDLQSLYRRGDWLKSFHFGATDTIIRRLREEKERAEAASESTMALVVTNEAEIEGYIAEHLDVKKRKQREIPLSMLPYAQGAIAGENIPLQQGVEDGPAPTMLR